MLYTLLRTARRQMSVGTFSFAALCSVGALAQNAAPLKVGISGPMSGGSAGFGQAMLNGIQVAVSEINAAGGYLGRPVDPVISTVGFCNTGAAIKAIPVFQSSQSPLIVPCAAGSPVTQQVAAPASYVFRNSSSEDIKAPCMVKDILRRGLNKVAILPMPRPAASPARTTWSRRWQRPMRNRCI